MQIEVPVKTKMIMSCFECPYVTVRRIGDLHKVFCNNTYEETEVEKKRHPNVFNVTQLSLYKRRKGWR